MVCQVEHCLKSFNFQQSKSDYSLFTKVQGTSFTAILVYVDDFLVGGNEVQSIEETKEFLSSQFYMKDLGSLRYFLGLEIDLTAQGYFLS